MDVSDQCSRRFILSFLKSQLYQTQRHLLDFTTLLQILPPSSPRVAKIQQSIQSLKPRIEFAQKRETDEMLGKLKTLGNSLLGELDNSYHPQDTYTTLGNFGLSTDNFKFEPNGQGGYSMNFSQ